MRKRHYEDVTEPYLYHLKELQSKRLRETYDDLAQVPKYEAACWFFFNRLYSTENTHERDEAFRKIYKHVVRFLGGDVARSMARLIEVQEITVEMDEKIVSLLQAEEAALPFSVETYERVYRESDNYDLRVKQIELLEFTVRLVHKISHRFGIGLVLKGLHGACMITGDTRMVDFLMDGYKAFANLRDINPLAEAIGYRERQRLDRIFGFEFEARW